MATRSEIIESIANLESLIDSAATSHSVDGQSTTFDLNQALRRLIDLPIQLDVIDGSPKRRPSSYSIIMSDASHG